VQLAILVLVGAIALELDIDPGWFVVAAGAVFVQYVVTLAWNRRRS
jgi:hypothetical protein